MADSSVSDSENESVAMPMDSDVRRQKGKTVKTKKMDRRSSNFTAHQIERMVDILLENQTRIDGSFNKGTRDHDGTVHGVSSRQAKEDIWEKIRREISALGTGPKSIKQIKKKKTTLFSAVKAKAGDLKKAIQKTGSGPDGTEGLTELESKIISLIGDEVIEGIDGGVTSRNHGNSNANNNESDESDSANIGNNTETTPIQTLAKEDIRELLAVSYHYLRDILDEKIPCRRMQDFNKGGIISDSLRYRMPIMQFSDKQCDWAMEAVLEDFCSEEKDKLEYFDVVSKVLFPEFLIKLAMDKLQMDHTSAESHLMVVDEESYENSTTPFQTPRSTHQKQCGSRRKTTSNRKTGPQKQAILKRSLSLDLVHQTPAKRTLELPSSPPAREELILKEMKKTNDVLVDLVNVQKQMVAIQKQQLEMQSIKHQVFLLERNFTLLPDDDGKKENVPHWPLV